jgi:DNA replication protein DnaC
VRNTSSKDTGTWSSAEEEDSPSANCPVCQGAGFVHPVLDSGKADFSRVVTCRCLHNIASKERRTLLERYSNLGSLSRLTFDNFIPRGRSGYASSQEKIEAAYQATKDFADEPKGWLVLIGPSGCGKTHLAAAIANEYIGNGNPAFFITAADLLDHLRSAFSPSSEITYDRLFDQIRNTPLLILDDLGAQSSTHWAKEKMEQLLNHRFNNELPTVITTSTPMEQLNDRLRTRLIDPRLCQVYSITEDQADAIGYSWGPGLELQKMMTFSNFDWKRVNLSLEQRANLELIYRQALEFAKSPDGWLVLQGVTGCGKTHLAAAIVNYRYQTKKPALFVVVPEFLDHLRSTFSPESKVSYDQLFEKVKTTPLLVLDDFGEQVTTPWAQEKLYQVINYRYNARLATVITTRCSLDEIDTPISSRFFDRQNSLMFEILAPDYRVDREPRRSTKTYRRSRGSH